MNHLTVREILQKDAFKYARLIAGDKGLDNPVKWTHIIETSEFDSLLNGGELILTTGMNLELETSLETLAKLIEKKVSGICIEIGPHFNNLSPTLKKFADEHHFPIIVFDRTVKFVDITQKLHTFIINQHYEMLHMLNHLNKKFTELSLLPNGILKILEALHDHFCQTALFVGNDRKAYYYPPETKEISQVLQTTCKHQAPKNSTIVAGNKIFAASPVHVLGQVWGYLFLKTDQESQKEFIISVLDGAAQSIAQILLRNRTIEERKMNQEDELVHSLLLGKPYNKDELELILPSINRDSMSYRVIIIQNKDPILKNEEEWKEIKVHRALTIRSLCKQNGIYPAVSVRKSETAVICFFNSQIHDEKKITNLAPSLFDRNTEYFGISARHGDTTYFSKAYNEAKEAIFYNQINNTNTSFYDKIGVSRLLFQLKDTQLLERFIQDQIGPLIAYDKKMKTGLLQTLEVYLKYNESKKEAAERLHIVRQTLYHRLEKMKELLGESYLEPSNRLAIEVAIEAYRVVKPSKKLPTIAHTVQ